MIEVALIWLASFLFVSSAIGFVVGVRLLIEWYEQNIYKPRMRKQRDTF